MSGTAFCAKSCASSKFVRRPFQAFLHQRGLTAFEAKGHQHVQVTTSKASLSLRSQLSLPSSPHAVIIKTHQSQSPPILPPTPRLPLSQTLSPNPQTPKPTTKTHSTTSPVSMVMTPPQCHTILSREADLPTSTTRFIHCSSGFISGVYSSMNTFGCGLRIQVWQKREIKKINELLESIWEDTDTFRRTST